MDIVVWLIEGLVIGSIARLVMGVERRQPVAMSIGVAMLGALLTGLLIAPTLGMPTGNEGRFSFGAAVVPAIGALALLIVVTAVRRGRR
jgi:uncharacterized membrane protein YeaQ/YmgE (transglycosylase-associated protein family)